MRRRAASYMRRPAYKISTLNSYTRSGDAQRDPTAHTVAVAYFALVPHLAHDLHAFDPNTLTSDGFRSAPCRNSLTTITR
jgi:hypothetical protein